MAKAVVSVGSNVAPEKNVPEARRRIAAAVRILSESAWTKTEPLGPEGRIDRRQPEFLNGVLMVETNLSRSGLEKKLKGIENEMGRVRTKNKFTARIIDLDVVVWDGKIVNQDIHDRGFLKKAVEEVWPGLL